MEALDNYFQLNADPKVSNDFPLMYGAPLKLLVIITMYAIFALAIGPRMMRDRKPYDLRPWMLVYNGFMFGVSGAGSLVALWITQMGTNSWSCRDDGDRWEGITGMTFKYLGYVYLFVKMFDFATTVFDVLRKRENADLKGQVVHNAYMVMFAYIGIKYYPRGMFCFMPMLDLMMQSIRCAYLVLASAGSALRFSLWWKNYVAMAQIIQLLILLTHSVYVTITPNCAGPIYIKLAVFLYAITSLPYYFSLVVQPDVKTKTA